ncbi:unnamed protein product [Protopolystoma xenopodis]|uniref:Uncharacterized protein n=1 Tax=Protopolystoma xenopodis TaxID=117903 RepID=A0A448XM30_9PLAT|nr:unnamed protein product [Protopolystoma xenopodis]
MPIFPVKSEVGSLNPFFSTYQVDYSNYPECESQPVGSTGRLIAKSESHISQQMPDETAPLTAKSVLPRQQVVVGRHTWIQAGPHKQWVRCGSEWLAMPAVYVAPDPKNSIAMESTTSYRSSFTIDEHKVALCTF